MCGILKSKGKLKIEVSTVMTDFKYHEQWLEKHEYLEKFFVSNEKMKQDLIEFGLKPEKVFAMGMPISQRFLEKFDKKKIQKEFGLKENLKTILFFAGGKMGLATKNIFEYMEILTKKAEAGEIQVIAISGKNPKVYKKFEEIAKNKKNTKVLEFTNKVPELMSISDLCITKPGGITSSESLASNVPILAINPIPGQEEENAEYLEGIGCAIWLKKKQNMNEILNDVIKDEKLQKLKENTAKQAKPNSAINICKKIL